MGTFAVPLDVANRSCQLIGVPRIANFTGTKAGLETGFAIDKIRQAELRRSVWTFATRRAVLRPTVSTTLVVSFAAWAIGTTYAVGDVAADSNGYLWMSARASNIGNIQGAGGVNPFWISYYGPVVAQVWGSTTQYFPGDMIYTTGSPSVIYIAVAPSLNQTQPNATYWHIVAGATGAASVQFAPLGVDPPTGATTRSIYLLPANYIRLAPQDPKQGAIARQGTTAGLLYTDWEIESGYLFTNQAAPIIFRFVADETDVTLMDALFCEVWAAHLSAAITMPLTQSSEKFTLATEYYNRSLRMAKTMNAIEEGNTDQEISEDAPPRESNAQQGGNAPQGGP